MDEEIGRFYADRGVEAVKPRYVMPLLRLAGAGPSTIKALAEGLSLTHSAVSQTVAAMERDGLVTTRAGERDARTKEVVLTDTARELVPLLEREWRATEAALAELERDIPYPLSRVVQDVEDALRTTSFSARIERHLPEPR